MLRERFYNLISLLSYLSAFAAQILPTLRGGAFSDTTHKSSRHPNAAIFGFRTLDKRCGKECPWGLNSTSSHESGRLAASAECSILSNIGTMYSY